MAYKPLEDVLFLDYLSALEKDRGLPPGILRSIARRESGGNPNAQSKTSSAVGMFQLLAQNRKNIDARDPKQAAKAAADLLAEGKKLHGSTPAAIAHYRGGTAAGRAVKEGKELPEEYARYVEGVAEDVSAGKDKPLTTVDVWDNAKPPQQEAPRPKPTPTDHKPYKMALVRKTVNTAREELMPDADIVEGLREYPVLATRIEAMEANGLKASDIVDNLTGDFKRMDARNKIYDPAKGMPQKITVPGPMGGSPVELNFEPVARFAAATAGQAKGYPTGVAQTYHAFTGNKPRAEALAAEARELERFNKPLMDTTAGTLGSFATDALTGTALAGAATAALAPVATVAGMAGAPGVMAAMSRLAQAGGLGLEQTRLVRGLLGQSIGGGIQSTLEPSTSVKTPGDVLKSAGMDAAFAGLGEGGGRMFGKGIDPFGQGKLKMADDAIALRDADFARLKGAGIDRWDLPGSAHMPGQNRVLLGVESAGRANPITGGFYDESINKVKTAYEKYLLGRTGTQSDKVGVELIRDLNRSLDTQGLHLTNMSGAPDTEKLVARLLATRDDFLPHRRESTKAPLSAAEERKAAADEAERRAQARATRRMQVAGQRAGDTTKGTIRATDLAADAQRKATAAADADDMLAGAREAAEASGQGPLFSAMEDARAALHPLRDEGGEAYDEARKAWDKLRRQYQEVAPDARALFAAQDAAERAAAAEAAAAKKARSAGISSTIASNRANERVGNALIQSKQQMADAAQRNATATARLLEERGSTGWPSFDRLLKDAATATSTDELRLYLREANDLFGEVRLIPDADKPAKLAALRNFRQNLTDTLEDTLPPDKRGAWSELSRREGLGSTLRRAAHEKTSVAPGQTFRPLEISQDLENVFGHKVASQEGSGSQALGTFRPHDELEVSGALSRRTTPELFAAGADPYKAFTMGTTQGEGAFNVARPTDAPGWTTRLLGGAAPVVMGSRLGRQYLFGGAKGGARTHAARTASEIMQAILLGEDVQPEDF